MRINPIDPIIRTKHRKKPNDQSYCKWLRTKPSAYSGLFPTIAAHYRTAKNSGMACKPLFSAIPLTSGEHAEQHRIGQYNFASRVWWEKAVKKYQALYEEETNKKIPEEYKITV